MLPVILDISRSVSRISRGRLTGIDRVELAYIDHFLSWPETVGFLARFRNYNVLLDRDGMRQLFQLLNDNGPWDNPDLLGRLRQRRRILSSRVETTLRRLSVSWSFRSLGVDDLMPQGFTYINVGHGAWRTDFWSKLKKTKVRKTVLLIHDVIPLDFPKYCNPKSVEVFAKEFKSAAENVDVLIFNSTDTQNTAERWLKKWDLTDIDGHVLFLGTDTLPETSDFSPPTHPYFVTLGTIEPRKNHRLLLDIWAEFQKSLPTEKTPHLYIVGGRGWLNEDVFRTLDTAEFMGDTVHEIGRISDVELGPLIANAKALLFPSFVEGFGLPLVEAMQLNTPVICSNLPCFVEIGEDFPTFIDPNDGTAWREQILIAATQNGNVAKPSHKMPNWPEHFHKLTTIIN